MALVASNAGKSSIFKRVVACEHPGTIACTTQVTGMESAPCTSSTLGNWYARTNNLSCRRGYPVR
eukprot:7601943-Karenia_brevis.AAC.1